MSLFFLLPQLFNLVPLPSRQIHDLGSPTRRPHNDPYSLLIAVVDLLVLSVRRYQGPVARVQHTFLLVAFFVQ